MLPFETNGAISMAKTCYIAYKHTEDSKLAPDRVQWRQMNRDMEILMETVHHNSSPINKQ